MGIEYREELVGKRFLCVVGNSKPKTPIPQWPWRAGIIRAVDKTTPAVHGKDAIVYVEFDGQDWDKREWLKINNKTHQVFLVEKTVVWAERVDPYAQVPSNIIWPALSFKILIDRCGLKDSPLKPTEFFLDNLLEFFRKGDIQPYKEDSRKTLNKPIFKRYPDIKLELDRWLLEQSEQHILMKAPYGLSGYRVKVYRIGSTTQWFTAVITGHDLMTRDLIVMDDTVLESHTENPAHVHMMFLDDVVNSLLKGENVGITSRRRTAAAVTANNNSQASSVSTYSRPVNSSHTTSTPTVNNPNPQAQKKKRTKGIGESNQDSEKETKDKTVKHAEKPVKDKSVSNRNKKDRKRKTEDVIADERRNLSDIVKKTKSGIMEEYSPGQEPELIPAEEISPMEERLTKQKQKDKIKPVGPGPLPASEAPGNYPKRPEIHSVPLANQSEMSVIPKESGFSKSGIESMSSFHNKLLKESKTMTKPVCDNEPMEVRSSRSDNSPAVVSVSNSCPSKETVQKQPPVVNATTRRVPTSSENNDESFVNSDSTLLYKLSQAIKANPGKRPVKPDRATPFNHAIAGIIARELSKDCDMDDRHREAKLEERGISPGIGISKVSPTPTSSVSASSRLYESMQSMISAQESVIPAVPSEAMVKNCLMKTMNLKQDPISTASTKDTRPSKTPPSQRPLPASRPEPERISLVKIDKGPVSSSIAHEVPRILEKPRAGEFEWKEREPTNHDRKERPRKETIEIRSREETNHSLSRNSTVNISGHVKEPVMVFRDPNIRDNSVTHVHSIQHNFHRLGKQEHQKPTPVSSHTPLSTLRTAATPGIPLSGSPSAFVPSNLHSNALPTHSILPPHLQLYQHHLQGLPYGALLPVDQHSYHQQQHVAELMAHQEALVRLRHQIGISGLVPGQAALLQASAAQGITRAQLQALLQSQHTVVPPGILVPHTQEELELAHLQAQREQTLHAEKLAQMETKAILHADKHIFSTSPKPPHHSYLSSQTTTSLGSTHHSLGHENMPFRGSDMRNHHQDLPIVDVHAAIERHFQESLGKPHGVAFSISPYNTASGSITMGTPLPKSDLRSVPMEKEHQQKEQLGQDRLRREREEKELEWQRLQREKEYKQNQIQKEMERKIMYPVSQQERLKKLASSIDVKNDDHLYKHVMSQLKPKYTVTGLSSMEKKCEKTLVGDILGPPLKSQPTSGKGFQVFQPYKSSVGSHKTPGHNYEEARPGVPVRTEHNRMKLSPSYMSAFQVKSQNLEGYVPFGHTVTSNKAHDKGENVLRSHHGPTHSPLGVPQEKEKKCIPNPPPLIKKEPGLGSPDFREGQTIHEMGTKSLWEKQFVENIKAQQGHSVKLEGSHSVPVIVRRNETGSPHMQPMEYSPLKVASPQQLSQAALQTMEVKSLNTTSSSRATSSEVSPGTNSTSLISQSSILMSALRPAEQQRMLELQSLEPKDMSLGGKRKSPNQPMAVKKRVKEAAVVGLPSSCRDLRRVAAVTSFSDHCQSYQISDQAHLISGSAVHAKVSENVELKIEKVDQLRRVTSDVSAAHKVTALSNIIAKNGSFSDSERSRSVSPRSMSDSSDSRKTSSPNRTATGHVKCKKAWLQRLSESTDSPPLQEEKKGTTTKFLPNGHIHSPRAVAERAMVTLSDIPKCIPGVYDFDNISTCSDSSSTSCSSKPRQRNRRENKKSRKRVASPVANAPWTDSPKSQVNGLNLGYENKGKVNAISDHHKEVTASLIDLMTKAPKKRIVTRAHKDKEAFNLTRSLSKPAISKLKKTGETFLQDGPCTNITPNLMKCRECRMKGNKQSKLNIFCRFYAFRRLRYSQKGNLTIAGFAELDQYEKEDLGPWLPARADDEPTTDIEVSKYIMLMAADKFCELVLQEQNAKKLSGQCEVKMAWKRPVSGVREMCDTCDTTLFNIHWTCPKCGFVVCPDCFKARNGGSTRSMKAKSPEVWLKCIKDQHHIPENLMLTQIIPGSALWDIGALVHKIRKRWNLPARCPCSVDPPTPSALDLSKQSEDTKSAEVVPLEQNLASNIVSTTCSTLMATSSSTSALDFLADIATSQSNDVKRDFDAVLQVSQNGESQVDTTSYVKTAFTAADTTTDIPSDSTGNPTGDCSTLRELLTKTANRLGTPAGSIDGSSFLSALLPRNENNVKSKHRTMTSTFEDIIATVVEQHIAEPHSKSEHSKSSRGQHKKSPLGIQTGSKNTLTESSFLYPDVPHSWLCDGNLLRLHDPANKGNFKIFQEQWGKGEPVLVSNVHKQLKSSLWHPRYFIKQFGSIENDLVDCRKGTVIQGAPMKDFWDGFDDLANRLETKNGQAMILKLKDWPPAEDFSEILPDHFEDLMNNLPLPEYTQRDGVLNLSSRLPDFFVKPDLGPKMYNAYGLARHPSAGTTNLHLDISDAVNVMVYVGVPFGGQAHADHVEELKKEAIEAVEEHCKDEQTLRRVHEDHETIGALWHIFRAQDTPKIRLFLNKLSEGQGEKLLADHDPIHDQSWYLDAEKLAQLKEEYNVEGWAIAQFQGDAVFIPAGTAHQVRNLHSCIKVAEDFVSPEHIKECIWLTEEFRHLSNTHSNHEDKLQIKNILYHAIKDATGVLMSHDPLLTGPEEA